MGKSHNSDRDRSALRPPEPSGNARQTVLLSDLPESAAPIAPAAMRSNPTLRHINLNPDTLAALGVRYEILGDAGSGSMGNVYKACDRETGGIVALKLLKPEIASDQQMMDRFKRELLFARKITHKNVCRVYDFNRVNGVAYTSMEFVEGESLRATLNRLGKLPVQRATEIALQICSGLKEAHAQGIVHRDLKPENVMIDSAGNVKIMDFGIARSMDAGTRLTGSLAGTPAYMAPEQVAGKPVDYRTDIYSVGLVLYEMFTGAPAFKAENSVAVALKQMSEEVVPPHVVEPTIPVSIERTILKCLEKEPERRYLSIAELETALAASLSQRTVTAAPWSAAQAKPQNASAPDAHLPAAHPAAPVVAQRKSGPPFLWVLVGVGLTFASLAALHALTIQKAAKQIVFHEKFKPPIPPDFAYEVPKAAAPEPAPTSVPESTDKVDTPALDQPKPAAQSKPSANKAVAGVTKPPASQDVFPRMEAGPVRNHSQPSAPSSARASKIAPVDSVPNEYIWAGRYPSQSKARERQKKVEAMMYPSKIVLRRFLNHDYWVLWVGPVKVTRGPITLEALEAKGFSGAREVPLSEYQKAVK